MEIQTIFVLCIYAQPYIADFVCLELKLIIELDGSQHSEQVDNERTQFLNQLDFRVSRFWNHDLFNNLEAVLEQINLVIGEQKKVVQ